MGLRVVIALVVVLLTGLGGATSALAGDKLPAVSWERCDSFQDSETESVSGGAGVIAGFFSSVKCTFQWALHLVGLDVNELPTQDDNGHDPVFDDGTSIPDAGAPKRDNVGGGDPPIV